MPFFPSLDDDALVADIYRMRRDVYSPWIRMGQAVMQGESALGAGEREVIAAFVSALNGCDFCHRTHLPVIERWGIDPALIDRLVEDIETAPVEPKFKPLYRFLRKLAEAPATLRQADADAVFAAGWDEAALHDAIAVACRFAFMNRLVMGMGLAVPPDEVARANAEKRAAQGYAGFHGDLGEDGGAAKASS